MAAGGCSSEEEVGASGRGTEAEVAGGSARAAGIFHADWRGDELKDNELLWHVLVRMCFKEPLCWKHPDQTHSWTQLIDTPRHCFPLSSFLHLKRSFY